MMKLFGCCRLLAVALLLLGCQSVQKPNQASEKIPAKTKLIYGLGDDELNLLGERLGCHVKALGMSGYSFTCGDQVFDVIASNDLLVRDRICADEPVVLRYEPLNRKSPLEMRFSIAQGVTLAEVEAHFRKFMNKMQQTK